MSRAATLEPCDGINLKPCVRVTTVQTVWKQMWENARLMPSGSGSDSAAVAVVGTMKPFKLEIGLKS